MSDEHDPGHEPNRGATYAIRIRGHLDAQLSDWFEGLTITLEAGGDTLLTGPVTDQAALHGLLKRVRDLGMPLIAVNRVTTDAPHTDYAAEEKK